MGKKCKDHLENEFNSVQEMCNYWNINYSTFRGRINRKWKLKDALIVEVKDNKCFDHLGNEYNNQVEMCKHWKISDNTFRERIRIGWSLENALTVNMVDKKAIDHLGNEYSTVKAMCNYWNISLSAFNYRIKNKWSLKDALTIKVEPVIIPEQPTDHIGNKFNCLEEMCEYWNIPINTFKTRIRHSWSIEDALTAKIGRSNNKDKPVDHLGNKFNTVEEMCEHWDISYSSFYTRMANNMTVEEALTVPLREKDMEPVDHLGNRFDTLQEMCKHWGISKGAFQSRLQLGWSLEDALTIPPKQQYANRNNCRKVTDHLGQEFKSITEMCKHWGVKYSTFNSRIRYKWSVKDALTTKV